MKIDDLVSLNIISTFVCYLMPKTSLFKNSSGTIQPIAGRIREFIRISPKTNVIVRLEFELAYYEVIDQYVSHYGTRTHFYWELTSAKTLLHVIVNRFLHLPKILHKFCFEI